MNTYHNRDGTVTPKRVLTEDRSEGSFRLYGSIRCDQASIQGTCLRAENRFTQKRIDSTLLLAGIADHLEVCYVKVILRRSVAGVLF
jgi:hypothetical protein